MANARPAEGGRLLDAAILSRHYEDGAANDGQYRETEALEEELGRRFGRVHRLAPSHVAVRYPREGSRPDIRHRGEDIGHLALVIVRDARGSEAMIAAVCAALELCGCENADPVERFRGVRASKVDSTPGRFMNGTGTGTWVVGVSAAEAVLHRADMCFPAMIKPARGRHGEGIVKVDGPAEAMDALADLRRVAGGQDEPVLIQEYIPFRSEWRVVVVDGFALGAARKLSTANGFLLNAARGATFVQDEAPAAVDAATRACPGVGIRGVDVAEDESGALHVIETNWAPSWAAFEAATGVDVAAEIAERMLKRIEGQISTNTIPPSSVAAKVSTETS